MYSMAKIIFLGTAASIPSKNRDNTSFLFIYKKDIILVDCPGSIVQKLIKLNIDFRKIKTIVLTHHHPDHIYGLYHLVHTQASFSKRLDIFCNQHTTNLLKKTIVLLKLNKRMFPKINYFNVFKKEFFYCKNDLKLKAVKNKHMPGSFGIKFIFKNKSLFYSSDTALSKSILKEGFGCDYLIHDCTASSHFFKKHPSLYKMHTSALTLAKSFSAAKLKKIIPIHFLIMEEQEEKRIKKELKILKDKLVIPRDFQALLL